MMMAADFRISFVYLRLIGSVGFGDPWIGSSLATVFSFRMIDFFFHRVKK
jgi:hypothetical protein